jgi:hypothetical protein
MQEKMQIFSPIKQRILHFIDYLKITKREFYTKTGISRGTLESKTGITEETLAKFFATYGEIIDIEWLITGKGKMLTDNKKSKTENSKLEDDITPDPSKTEKKYIKCLEDEMSRLLHDNVKKQELIDAFMSGGIVIKPEND